MHQSGHLHRRVPHGALVRLERSAAKVARCVLRGERSREAPDLPGVLRIVTPAELKRLNGSRPKRGRGTGLGDINGRPPHVQSPPVYRGALPPFVGTPCETW
jgi:hypothetical protein